MDERDHNLEAAEQIAGRTVKGVEVDYRSDLPETLVIDFEDGSRIRVGALRGAALEIAYLSASEIFEIDRAIMEEAIVIDADTQLRKEGHLPQLFDDRLIWTELPPVAGRESGVPWVTHEARIEIERGILRIYRMSDGRRLVDQSDIQTILGAPEDQEAAIVKAVREGLRGHDRSGTDPDPEAGRSD